jgi:predicted enzyme related to lactoylglutathione lyase
VTDTLPPMGERTSYPPGTFSWADLGTTDTEAAKAFYTQLFGWEAEDAAVTDAGPYTMLRLGGLEVCALYERNATAGPPAWLAYVTVRDVDESARRAQALGATLAQEPIDVVDAGRMAVVQDPTGAFLALWQPRSQIGARLVNDPGAMCLNQLNTTDPDAAQRFYTMLFGWRVQFVGPTSSPTGASSTARP